MTERNIKAISNLRKQNYSYASIAKALGLNPNTVKSICQRNGIATPAIPRKTKAEKQILQVCKQCGRSIANPWHRTQKLFCSDKCRTAYWNAQKALSPKPSKKAAKAPESGQKCAGLPGPGEVCLTMERG